MRRTEAEIKLLQSRQILKDILQYLRNSDVVYLREYKTILIRFAEVDELLAYYRSAKTG